MSEKPMIKEAQDIELLLILMGRKLSSKAVMFKDDVANMKNIEKALTNVMTIIKREADKCLTK